MEFQAQETIYFAVMWAITFLAGVSRTVRDHSYSRLGDVIAVGSCGGFWGFTAVGICSYFGPSLVDFGWAYLGLSAGIGLLGKEQDQLMRYLIRGAIKRITGIKLDEQPEQPEENQKGTSAQPPVDGPGKEAGQ